MFDKSLQQWPGVVDERTEDLTEKAAPKVFNYLCSRAFALATGFVAVVLVTLMLIPAGLAAAATNGAGAGSPSIAGRPSSKTSPPAAAATTPSAGCTIAAPGPGHT